MSRVTWGLLLATSLMLGGCGVSPRLGAPVTSTAAQTAANTPFRVVRTATPTDWARIECLESTLPGFPNERMRPNGRHRNADIVKAFGSATPPSKRVLLHYMPGWDRQDTRPPVLLVHGTVVDATNCWLKTSSGRTGLATTVAASGRRVFAVTFANRHSDNHLWAQNLNDAIARIREVTGATQVDLVAHSKGAMGARVLASNVRYPWMSPFHGDIRHLVLVGAPLDGIDFTFRHSIIGYGLFPEKDETVFNAPIAWTRMLVNGFWADSSAVSIYANYGNYFPGQAQMLRRWDKEYPLNPTEPDWYSTYHGGQGLLSQSEGIDQAIAESGNYMAMLQAHPLDPRVALAVAAGDHADIEGIHNEHTGPSDGVAFLKSASAVKPLIAGGAKLLANQTLPVNHMGLIADPAAQRWILDQL